MAQKLEHTLLKKLVQTHLPWGSGTFRLSPIPRGKFNIFRLSSIPRGKFNTSFWVETSGPCFVLRLAPPEDQEKQLLFYEKRMMRQEPTLHSLIRSRTTIPVPEIVAYDFSHSLIDRDYLIMEALEGVPLSEAVSSRGRGFRFSGKQLKGILRHLGSYLGELHALTAPDCLGVNAYGYLGEHQPMQPRPGWLDTFRGMWGNLLNDIVRSGGYPHWEALALRVLFEQYSAHFDRPVTPRLLHMDGWSQNILVNREGQVTGLLDFDRVLWGDKELEFAVLDWCGLSEPAFWEGYGRVREESEAARIRRQFYLLYEMQKYIPLEIWRGRNPAIAQNYKQLCRFLAQELIPDI